MPWPPTGGWRKEQLIGCTAPVQDPDMGPLVMALMPPLRNHGVSLQIRFFFSYTLIIKRVGRSISPRRCLSPSIFSIHLHLNPSAPPSRLSLSSTISLLLLSADSPPASQ
jgi:hypothetical protein